MKRMGIALLAATVLATPAAARDKSLYVGIEGGVMWAKDTKFDAEAGAVDINDFLVIDNKMGYDIDALYGYDGGMVRAELELGYKRASHDEYVERLVTGGTDTFDADGRTRYLSVMANLLLDVGNEDGISFYAGPGAGFAWGKYRLSVDGDSASFRDGGVAWQLIAGVRYAVSPNIDLGLKYRYFVPSRVKKTIDGVDFDGRFKSHSLLASLIYNFYTPPAPPPPPYVPPAPEAAPPPATQTCPDGSVILASDVCPPPAPPPPPPPPEPEPERG